MSGGRRSEERGSATVWVLAFSTVLALAGAAGVLVGSAVVTRHRAAAAADLAALAAAGRAVREIPARVRPRPTCPPRTARNSPPARSPPGRWWTCRSAYRSGWAVWAFTRPLPGPVPVRPFPGVRRQRAEAHLRAGPPAPRPARRRLPHPPPPAAPRGRPRGPPPDPPCRR